MFWTRHFETDNCQSGCLGKYSDVRYCKDYSQNKGYCCSNGVLDWYSNCFVDSSKPILCSNSLAQPVMYGTLCNRNAALCGNLTYYANTTTQRLYSDGFYYITNSPCYYQITVIESEIGESEYIDIKIISYQGLNLYLINGQSN